MAGLGSVVWPAGLVGVLLSATGDALGGIAYDNITGKPGRSVLISSDDEFADDTAINPGAGMTISAVRARLYNASLSGYTGELRVWIYADAGGVPGALLGSASAPLSMASHEEGTYEVPFGALAVGTTALWTGYQVPLVGPQAQVGIVIDKLPNVGTSSDLEGRHKPDLSWTISHTGDDNFMLQIVTVPGPGVFGPAGLGLLLASRRRRRGD